ncbi:H/ACA ribonucleoprotein complex subunit 1 [Verticillium alfalfae VaMs.102]|uniref:H/ACA ribonucleoprotein complex subunit 1 n=1 Tax=Verticillium alfalfae (strain VaMs.102 / ATCC MYA-4576 / FGSC 10136) TaxID=526221 RepID=C9SXT7_VERA1|nr:H/ACA ribonucleoprotein complex subunit 1 [Verticillium alfalfae VaMs.102]EEY23602.1 H/ACA ribonucleoprotein complex subunit 1 [Verticillium alfalfae VaMs.102]
MSFRGGRGAPRGFGRSWVEAVEVSSNATWVPRRKWASSCTPARVRWSARASTPRYPSSTPRCSSRTRPPLARSTKSSAPSTKSTSPSSPPRRRTWRLRRSWRRRRFRRTRRCAEGWTRRLQRRSWRQRLWWSRRRRRLWRSRRRAEGRRQGTRRLQQGRRILRL